MLTILRLRDYMPWHKYFEFNSKDNLLFLASIAPKQKIIKHTSRRQSLVGYFLFNLIWFIGKKISNFDFWFWFFFNWQCSFSCIYLFIYVFIYYLSHFLSISQSLSHHRLILNNSLLVENKKLNQQNNFFFEQHFSFKNVIAWKQFVNWSSSSIIQKSGGSFKDCNQRSLNIELRGSLMFAYRMIFWNDSTRWLFCLMWVARKCEKTTTTDVC